MKEFEVMLTIAYGSRLWAFASRLAKTNLRRREGLAFRGYSQTQKAATSSPLRQQKEKAGSDYDNPGWSANRG